MPDADAPITSFAAAAAAAAARVTAPTGDAPAVAPAPVAEVPPAVIPAPQAPQAPVTDPVAHAPQAPAATEPVVDPAQFTAPAPPADPDDVIGQMLEENPGDVLPRSIVERARAEAAKHRVAAKEATALFDGLDDGERGYWQEAMTAYRTNRSEGVKSIFQDTAAFLIEQGIDPVAELSKLLGGAPAPTVQPSAIPAQPTAQQQAPAAPGQPGFDPNAPMTFAQFQAIQQAQAAEAAQQAQIAQVRATATELGYEVGSDAYNYLLAVAGSRPDRDVRKAHESIQLFLREQQARQQNELVQGKVAVAQTVPAPVAAPGTATAQPQAPKSFKEAGERAAGRFRQAPPL